MSCTTIFSLAVCQALLLNMHKNLQYSRVRADTLNFAYLVNHLILISYPATVTMFSCTDGATLSTTCTFHSPHPKLKLPRCSITGKLMVQPSCGPTAGSQPRQESHLSACHKAQRVQREFKLWGGANKDGGHLLCLTAPAELDIEDAVGVIHISVLPILSAWQDTRRKKHQL